MVSGTPKDHFAVLRAEGCGLADTGCVEMGFGEVIGIWDVQVRWDATALPLNSCRCSMMTVSTGELDIAFDFPV